MKLSMVVLILFSLPALGYAGDIHVPADYLTIQEAIIAALNQDTIIVAPGTYEENIDFLGKEIWVISSDGAKSTTIRGTEEFPVVLINKGETEHTGLKGFTITSNAPESGGVVCTKASPKIMNNIIRGLRGPYAGSGIFCSRSSAFVAYNLIERNQAFSGAGIYCEKCPSDMAIVGNTIRNNESELGGGIYCYGQSSPLIMSNVITNNIAGNGGGIYCFSESSPTLTNNIITDNTGGAGAGIFCFANCSPAITNNTICNNSPGSEIWSSFHCFPTVINSIIWDEGTSEGINAKETLSVTYSNIKGGWPGDGNLDMNPEFVDPAHGDYHLTFHSPCRDAGSHVTIHAPDSDFEGDPRELAEAPDIGADEFFTHLYAMGHFSPGSGGAFKITEIPGTQPVILWAGTGLAKPPMVTPYGLWYLGFPLIYEATLAAIPSNGVAVFPVRIPPNMTSPLDIPLQAFVGDQLTQYIVIHVE